MFSLFLATPKLKRGPKNDTKHSPDSNSCVFNIFNSFILQFVPSTTCPSEVVLQKQQLRGYPQPQAEGVKKSQRKLVPSHLYTKSVGSISRLS